MVTLQLSQVVTKGEARRYKVKGSFCIVYKNLNELLRVYEINEGIYFIPGFLSII